MFEFREALVRQIIFAMENQKLRYLIDTEKGVLIQESLVTAEERPDTQTDPHGRYQDLPTWKSADGFFLMEQFLTEVHEPMIRDRLQTILVSGNRVFRRFKDTIQESPEIQRRYYRFKYRAMRDVVVEWYNTIRELAGLDTMELGVDEELDDLLMSDVEIEVLNPVPGAFITELDRLGFYEARAGIPEALVRHLYAQRQRRLPAPGDARSVVFGARTPERDLAAFLWVVEELIEDGSALHTIQQVYVIPEYRGLGIATELIETSRRYAGERDGVTLIWRGGPDMPASRALARATGARSLENVFLFQRER